MALTILDVMERYGPLIGRIFLSVIFLKSCVGKIMNFAGTQQFMAAAGMPMTALFLTAAIVLEFVGVASLVLGYRPRVGAWALIVFLVPATLIFHTNFADQMQQGQFLKNLAMLGGLFYVATYGSGPLSLTKSGR